MTATLTYPGVGFGGKVFMQDFTSAECNSSIATNTQGTLIDLRDNNVYWVARLKDGNCWMTQNLAYEDPNSTKITSASGWTTSATSTFRAYYNSGNINTNYPGFTPTDLENALKEIQSDWIYTNDDAFREATRYTSADGKMICTKTAGSWKGDVASDYLPCRMYTIPQNATYSHSANQHNSYGFHYSWESATNGSGSSTADNQNATNSICPNINYDTSNVDDKTSWILPTSNSTTNKGSFGLLVSGSGSGTAWANAVKVAPYYFQPGGNVYYGSLNYVDSDGYYWSSTAASAAYAYDFSFDSSGVNPSDSRYRHAGLSVRCLVLGS